MIKRYLFLFIALIGGWLQVSAQTESDDVKKLIVRGSDNYPPFEYINAEGKPDGFNVELFKALMVELGREYDLQLGDWDSIIEDIQEKRIDAVLGMIYSKERASEVRFTLPTCVINRNFITREQDGYHSFEELKGKEVIVERGGWFHRYVLENDLGITIIESDDIDESLALLVRGEHDAVLASELVAGYAIKKHNYKRLRVRNMGIEPQNYSIAVNQDEGELLYQMNLGLQRLKLSGVYDQIYNKWFGIYESQKNRKSLYVALGIFFFIASWLVAFVLLLRNRISRATRMLHYSQQEVGIAIDAGNVSAWAYIIHYGKIHSLHGKALGFENGPIDDVYERIHPEDEELVRAEFGALSVGRKQSTSIAFRIREDDSAPYRYVETKMVRVEATKELPCRIVGTLKDVTEEILMKQRLEDFSMKTRFIIKTNGIILIQYNIRTQEFFRINDLDSSDKVKHSVEDYLSMVHPDDIAIAKQFVEDMNSAENPNFETEFRFVAEDGTYNWTIISAVAYKYDEMGRITSYIGLRRDNTKWRAINDDLVALKEQADASNRLKSAFLANISHEIRTPLNAIVGFSELIIDTENHEEREQFFDIIQTNNTLLLQLINDVLDLSNIESGHDMFSYTTFDFGEYFRNLYHSLKPNTTANVKLICINHDEKIDVCSDPDRISQVITNYVNNAFKFTRVGEVTLDYVRVDEGVRIMVTDTGMGISKENHHRVFDRFEKVDAFAQGTGLGLSICTEIALALHGKVGVESELGKGATFWFWIPCNASLSENF